MQTISRRSLFALCFGSAAASVAASSLPIQAAPASQAKPLNWHPSDDGLVLCRVWESYPFRAGSAGVLVRSAYMPASSCGRFIVFPHIGQSETVFQIIAQDRDADGEKTHTTYHYEYESGPKWWTA